MLETALKSGVSVWAMQIIISITITIVVIILSLILSPIPSAYLGIPFVAVFASFIVAGYTFPRLCNWVDPKKECS